MSITHAFRLMSDEVRRNNIEKGWLDESGQSDRTFGEDIALLHSELSEALDAFRQWGLADVTLWPRRGEQLPKPEGVGSELADVLIRLVDLAESRGINLAAEYHRKMAFNRTRAWRHGGKAL